MSARDPLVCMDLLAAGQAPECGESTTAHCSSCKGCPGACACPPLPVVGTQVMPKHGVRSLNREVPRAPHTVVGTHDHRRDGEPADYVIVAQLSSLVRDAVARGLALNADNDAYLGLDDVEIRTDLPRITFTAKEN